MSNATVSFVSKVDLWRSVANDSFAAKVVGRQTQAPFQISHSAATLPQEQPVSLKQFIPPREHELAAVLEAIFARGIFRHSDMRELPPGTEAEIVSISSNPMARTYDAAERLSVHVRVSSRLVNQVALVELGVSLENVFVETYFPQLVLSVINPIDSYIDDRALSFVQVELSRFEPA